jgi:membrane protein implicated in regulation of membrane protease activity
MAPVQYEALITGAWTTVFSALALIAAFVLGEPEKPWMVIVALAFGALVTALLERRERRKIAAAPPAPPGTHADDFRDVLTHDAISQFPAFALLLILLLAVPEAGLFFAIIGAFGIGLLGRYRWISRVETNRARVCRVRGFRMTQRYAVAPLKDTAPAQRNPGHAQSEAARRAP